MLNVEEPGSWDLRDIVRGNLLAFGREPAGAPGTFVRDGVIVFDSGKEEAALMPLDLIRLRGEHNLRNVLAACAIAAAAGLPAESMQAGVRDFGGVEHRLEYVRTWRGADWYNDSIATAPERTMAAIQSFDEPLVLLLGGRDKNLPWEKLAELVRRRVDHVVVFGEAADKILRAIGDPAPGDRLQTISRQPGLEAAVQAAAAVVEPGDVVLLSPGGTSYDEFADFSVRGERFRKWVQALT